MLNVGEIIKAARQEAGISQASLARRAGTSQAAISRIERGLEDLTLSRLCRILAGMGMRPRIGLEPLADHGMSRAELAEAARMSPSERLQAFFATPDLSDEEVGG